MFVADCHANCASGCSVAGQCNTGACDPDYGRTSAGACGACTSIYCSNCDGSDSGACKDTACDNIVANTAGVYDTSDCAGLYLYTCKLILHICKYAIKYRYISLHISLFFQPALLIVYNAPPLASVMTINVIPAFSKTPHLTTAVSSICNYHLLFSWPPILTLIQFHTEEYKSYTTMYDAE